VPTDAPPVSTVEDLDPRPAPRKNDVEVRELLLGLLLLLAIIGWAVWQTQQQEGTATLYRLGQQAEKEGKWGEALGRYSAAPDYPGAADGVTRVTRIIKGLQEHIVSARWYAQEEQWASALLSVQSAGGIDPNYGNLASIEAEARAHVYSQAVQGAVVMREVDGLPALYYRSTTEWVPLPGSDGLSRVLASNGTSRFLYDIPVSWSTPDSVSPGPAEEAQSPGERLKDRRIAAALFDEGPPRFYTLSAGMNVYPRFKIGLRGVWGIPGSRTVRGDQSDMFSGEWPLGEPVGYQGFGSQTMTPLQLPGPDWVALQVEARAGRLLVADLTGDIVNVCVSAADGYNPYLVYSTDGALWDFLVSPDGRYVVLVIWHRITDPVQQQLAVLLDLRRQSQRGLVKSDISTGTETPRNYFNPQVIAGFLNSGMLAGKVLAARFSTDATTLSIFDPDRPGEPPVVSTLPAIPAFDLRVSEVNSVGDDAWPVITWEKDSGGASPPTGEVVAARFAPGNVAVTRTLTLQAESDVMAAGVRGDYMIWTARKRAVNVDGSKSAVQPVTFYSLPLRDLDQSQPHPTTFFNRPVPDPAQSRSVLGIDSSVSLGPEMLAYIEGTNLRARTYDGAVDVLLERGVVRFEGSTWPDVWPAR
jgi:hypothetical protein